MSNKGLAALELALQGWPIFPCEVNGKAPLARLAPNGLHDATTDITVVEDWWSREPEANIGLFPGPVGVLVVDVDRKPGRPDGYASIMDADPDWTLDPNHVVVSTPSGGFHYYTRGVGRSATHVLPGVDVKSAGGYVLAPGSEIDGRRYVGELPDPASITRPPPACVVRPPREAQTYERASSNQAPIDADALMEALAATDRDPTSYHDWVEVGFVFHEAKDRIVGADAFTLWDLWSMQADNYGGTEAKWKTFGRYPGSCAITVGSIFAEARKTGWKGRPEALNVDDLFADLDSPPPKPEPKSPVHRIYSGAAIKTAFRPTRMVFEELLPEGGVSLLIGGYDAGKTVSAVSLGLCAAAGRPWLGYPLGDAPPEHVLFLSGEGHELMAEYAAAYVENELGGVWPDNFHVCPWVPQLSEPEHLRQAAELITAVAAGGRVLIIADSWSRMTASMGDRNDEAAAQRILDMAEALTKQVNGTMLILGHPPKAELGEKPTTLSGSQQALNSAMAVIAFWNPMATKDDLHTRDADGLHRRAIAPMRVRGVAQPRRTDIHFASVDYCSPEGRVSSRPVPRPLPRWEGVSITDRPLEDDVTKLDLLEVVRKYTDPDIGGAHIDVVCDNLPVGFALSAKTLKQRLVKVGYRMTIPADPPVQLVAVVKSRGPGEPKAHYIVIDNTQLME